MLERPARRVLLLCSALCAPSACLPKDTRKPPGSLLVTLSSDTPLDASAPGIATSDAWTVHFQRFLISIADAQLDGDQCDPYSGSGYERVLNPANGEAQKIALLYARGPCHFGFSMESPRTSAVLGPGVEEQDRLLLRTGASDGYAATAGAGASLYVTGFAEKGPARKRFTWSFRERYEYQECKFSAQSASAGVLELSAHQALELPMVLHPATLFQADPRDLDAQPSFEPYARADDDGNADGDVSLAELRAVPLARSEADAGLVSLDTELVFADAGSWPTLGDRLYFGLVPQLLTVASGGRCRVERRAER